MKFRMTFRLWLLVILLLVSLISIFGIPPKAFSSGVLITSIDPNSEFYSAGLREGQTILSIDGREISSIKDYSNIFSEKFLSKEKIKTIISTEDSDIIIFTNSSPEITLSEISLTNLQFGLDISGGSRALVTAKNVSMTSEELDNLVEITRNRLGNFGLTEINVLPVSDLSGNRFMLIEIAGATPQDLEKLISEQGIFEAKIGNKTVFEGGEKGVSSVAKSGQEAGIYSCEGQTGAYYCNFRFALYLTSQAAKNQAEATSKLSINLSNSNYLNETLDLYLDKNLVNSLLISKDLKGRETTQISISGSGTGTTKQEAYQVAEKEMKHLQTVLITGSLPFELEIVKLDTISPLLGKSFIQSIFLAGIVAFIVITFIILIRYKNLKAALALVLINFVEMIIVLGVASFIGWSLDLASIAGIIAGIGTGVDSEIIVLDETRQKESLGLKEKLKRALSIIVGAYFTAVVSLLPLMWAGAGLLKGFAITTFIAITVGVLITRPAFLDLVEFLE